MSSAPETSYDESQTAEIWEANATYVIIFIPGIMGSCLRHIGSGKKLWHEDMLACISQLIKNPSLLKVSVAETESSVEAYSVLSEVRLSWFRTLGLYERLRKELRHQHRAGHFHYAEFPYDWRQSVVNNAHKLGQWLDSHALHLDEEDGEDKERRLIIIGHSMGCLVAATALMNGYISAHVVERFICVAPPFGGSPAAFRALFSTGYINGLDWLERIILMRMNRIASVSALLSAFQSFPSLYQLLPPVNRKFVWMEGKAFNPLRETVIPRWAKTAASDAHSRLSKVEEYLEKNKLKWVIIYGIAPRRRLDFRLKDLPILADAENDMPNDTDDEYECSLGKDAMFRTTYTRVDVKRMTPGDGTVSVESSTFGNTNGLNRYPIVGVRHAYMCHDGRVVDLINQWLPHKKRRAL